MFLMEDTIKIFVIGLKKWAKINKVNQATLGNIINRHQSSVSAYFKKEARPTKDMIDMWISALNLDSDEILTLGRRELQPPQDELRKIVQEEIAKQVPPKPPPTGNVVNYQSLRNADHHQKINEFQDQDLALKINHILVEIEKLDKTALEDIKDIAMVKLNSLLKRAETKRPGERPGKRA